jgi:hypothetical protein
MFSHQIERTPSVLRADYAEVTATVMFDLGRLANVEACNSMLLDNRATFPLPRAKSF